VVAAGCVGVQALICPDDEDIADGRLVGRSEDRISLSIDGVVKPIHNERPLVPRLIASVVNGKEGIAERSVCERSLDRLVHGMHEQVSGVGGIGDPVGRIRIDERVEGQDLSVLLRLRPHVTLRIAWIRIVGIRNSTREELSLVGVYDVRENQLHALDICGVRRRGPAP
jgi:hypothetical protein